MQLKSPEILFIDIQTTGPKPESANILEFSWVFNTSDPPQAYIISQPDQSLIPKRIQILTGITNESLKNSMSKEDLWRLLSKDLNSFIPTNPSYNCIIHFAQFEKPFLNDFLKTVSAHFQFNIFCTHEIAKRLLPNLPTRGIKGLAGYFGHQAGDLKRASAYVLATKVIWENLLELLSDKNIQTFEDLASWLEVTPKKSRLKYEYPLAKAKRLTLPHQPGVYRMVSQWGQVLYVGKATNLRDRVNSYFRGQKNRDQRKLEMLTQVWDLQVTTVASPLEAALLETDEIKRLDPPYNISLKSGTRQLIFFNRDFSSSQNRFDQVHTVGPFSTTINFDSLMSLRQCLVDGVFSDSIFFDPFDPQLLKEGFSLFCEQNSLCLPEMRSFRNMLALGIRLFRKIGEISLEDQEENDSISIDNHSDPCSTQAPIETEEDNPTPQDLADKFQRHFIRAGKSYLRAKQIKKLMNADIYFEETPSAHSQIEETKNNLSTFFSIRNGIITHSDQQSVECPDERPRATQRLEFNIETYDRMTVLLMELNKSLNQQRYSIKYK